MLSCAIRLKDCEFKVCGDVDITFDVLEGLASRKMLQSCTVHGTPSSSSLGMPRVQRIAVSGLSSVTHTSPTSGRPSISFTLRIVTTADEVIIGTIRKCPEKQRILSSRSDLEKRLEAYSLFRELWGQKEAAATTSNPACYHHIMQVAPIIKPVLIDFVQIANYYRNEQKIDREGDPTRGHFMPAASPPKASQGMLCTSPTSICDLETFDFEVEACVQKSSTMHAHQITLPTAEAVHRRGLTALVQDLEHELGIGTQPQGSCLGERLFTIESQLDLNLQKRRQHIHRTLPPPSEVSNQLDVVDAQPIEVGSVSQSPSATALPMTIPIPGN
jgi:hypothetical protein